MKQSHDAQIGWQVLKRNLPYGYVRRLFAELAGGNLPEEEVEEFLDEEVQYELARRLLAHGAEVGTDLAVGADDLEVDPIPRRSSTTTSSLRPSSPRSATAWPTPES